MPVTPKNNNGVVDQALTELAKRVDTEIWRALVYLGETAVREMRVNGNYKDQTRNLRGSTGYVIYDPETDSMRVGGFTPVDGQGVEGNKTGKDIAEQLARFEANKSRRLIVVAGMHYAEYVARKRNVTQSAKLLCEQLAPKIFANIKTAIEQNANK